MPTFDLTYEPWIPVLDASTDLRAQPNAPVVRHEVGLRDLLKRAHEIREVYSDSPLETVALYRLLLAIFIDGWVPKADPEIWKRQWRQGHFAPSDVDAYFDAPVRNDRFDLLHPERPFYQHPVPIAKTAAPIRKLFHQDSSGGNGTLFAHTMDHNVRPLAETARGLVCLQASAMGGGVSKPFYFSDAPLIGRTIFWIRGASLFESILLNAPPDRRVLLFRGNSTERPPAWERPLPLEYERRSHEGLLDYLTWQSRRITLITKENDTGLVATGLYLTQGDKEKTEMPFDPMIAVIHPVKKSKPPFPFNFHSEKALWRDAHLLYLLNQDDEGSSPLTFVWMKEWADELERSTPFIVDAFGLVNDKAKVELWRHEQLPIFPVLLSPTVDGNTALYDLVRALRYADEQAINLDKAIKTTTKYLLRSPKFDLDKNCYIDPTPETSEVRKLAKALDVLARYWETLSPHFYTFLSDLAQTKDHLSRQTTVWTWCEQIFEVAKTCFDEATAHLHQSASQLRATAQGQRRLFPVKAYREHKKSQPTPEPA